MQLFDQKKLVVLAISFWITISDVWNLSSQTPGIEPIRVGVFLDLTGLTSEFGRATLNGIKLAASEINEAGGIDGRQVELIIEDDRGRPTEVQSVVDRLIGPNKVDALLGENSSTNSLVAARIAQDAKVPMITLATHPAITKVGNYIFRVTFIDSFVGEVLAEFAIKRLKAKHVALFVDSTSDYSETLATVFENRLVRLGGRVVVRKSYFPVDNDYKAQLRAIKSFHPAAVFVPGYYAEAGIIARQARQVGLNVPLLGGDGWESRELWGLGGASLNGSYIAHHYASDNPLYANKKFVASYGKHYGGLEPDTSSAFGYDSLRMLADAIVRAGTTEGAKLRDALARTKDFEGVTGRITMNENRDALKAAVILRLQDGRFIYFDTVQPSKPSARNLVLEKEAKLPITFDTTIATFSRIPRKMG